MAGWAPRNWHHVATNVFCGLSGRVDLFSSSPRRRRAFTLLRGQRARVLLALARQGAAGRVGARAARLRHHGASRLPHRRDGAAIEHGGGACEECLLGTAFSRRAEVAYSRLAQEADKEKEHCLSAAPVRPGILGALIF
ncbi:hypothetical protein MRX96_035758 [Rhipicephalus microplus]